MVRIPFFLNARNERGSPSLTWLNMLRVLGVLGMLNVPHVLNVLNMPMDASLACWALFFDGGIVPDSKL